MKQQHFVQAMIDAQLAEKTISMRTNALLRVERHQGVDLDTEFERDGMASLLATFTYSTDDERSNRPNPTNMNVGKRSLRQSLSWYKSHLNQYRKFCVSGGADLEPDDDVTFGVTENDSAGDDPIIPSTFGLEADLQSALRENISQLEPGFEIIDGGVEKKVDSGFIDILARDASGTAVVIELKAGTARDAVIAQILGYMGDVADETGASVRGIIVASDFRPRVESAAKAIPNLSLKAYRYNFEFS